MTNGAGEPQPGRDVGSLAEEAAKLLGALSGWAQEHDLDEVADRASAVGHDLHEHLATGSPECTYCPICQAVRFLRNTSPEVRVHLASAGASLAQALTATLQAATSAAEQTPVERIPVDDDWPEEPQP